MFAFYFYFFFLFAILKKKNSNFEFQFKIQNSKFKIQNSKFKIQNSKFKIQNSKIKKKKKKKGEPFVGYIFWWAEIEPSYRATELRSQVKTISRSEPLSHWVVIRAIEPWFDQAKLRSEPSSRDMSQAKLSQDIWAILL